MHEYSPPLLSLWKLEISLRWVASNPALATNELMDFQNKFDADTWELSADFSRHGFITLIAKRKEPKS